jgi:nucleotide-binding universal stress UspA family protein
MAFRSILVHVDDGPSTAARIRNAVGIAQRFGSRVVAMLVTPTPQASVDIRELAPAEVAKLTQVRETREANRALLQSCAAQAGLGHVEMRVLTDDILDAAVAESRCADLTILGQPERDGNGAAFARRLAENAIIDSGAPVLMLPYAPSMKSIGDHVVVAWDGSREAARAVRDALPLLASAKRVTVMTVGERARSGEQAARSQERLAAYLGAHGIKAQLASLADVLDNAGEALLSRICDLGVDLVVMGGYGHARVREIVLGGLTRTMLDSMTVPVLMSH